ncbi:hypothetical protein, partial [Burkholderia sp. SIMBA_052]|uniref:hypothetical protein n=1 Tax=Burkholderia sp. SIMBA_052 TaxID=3085793 RepID=UPI00397C2621
MFKTDLSHYVQYWRQRHFGMKSAGPAASICQSNTGRTYRGAAHGNTQEPGFRRSVPAARVPR